MISALEQFVYYDTALKDDVVNLPGISLELAVASASLPRETQEHLQVGLQRACRKLCFMWHAGKSAIETEREWYATTIQGAPVLFGQDAVRVGYDLEAMVLFARSALDIAARVFGTTLPDPFEKKRYDSFNDLVKKVLKQRAPESLHVYLEPLRKDESSWLSAISGSERGRSLRDQITHQTEFPLEYIRPRSEDEKMHAAVFFGGRSPSLPDFVSNLTLGILDGFRHFETSCVAHLKK